MSNRTDKSKNAIKAAWRNEQQLVKRGLGTRDWTEQQQRDIAEHGVAYDEKGKAFQGHHMLSAELYPEHQEDPKNIQFLTRDEHKAAHNGNFQNPTIGYYNPETGDTIPFRDDQVIPCPVIQLSNPITLTDENSEVGNMTEDSSISSNTAAREDIDDMSGTNDDSILDQNTTFEGPADDMSGISDHDILDQNNATEDNVDDMTGVSDHDILDQNTASEGQTDGINTSSISNQNSGAETHQNSKGNGEESGASQSHAEEGINW